MEPDKQFLIDTANMKMPFGKYKGTYLIDIPEWSEISLGDGRTLLI